MSNLPKVSIVIACYNDPEVGVAIKSALNQTYSNKEIIVVDDGSSFKGVKKTLKAFKSEIDNLIIQDNKGQSVARNNGIKESTGKYVLNLDSDDYFEIGFVEEAVRILEKDPNVKIVTCKARRFNTKGTIDIFTPKGGTLDNFIFSNAALGSSMFRKKEWIDVGGYEEGLPILGFEDWEFYLNILKKGGYAYVIPEVLFNYQIRPNSTTARIADSKAAIFKHIFLKHQILYKNNFEELLNFFGNKMQTLTKEKLKRESSIEYQIGSKLLSPLRFIKNLWK